MMVSVLSLGQGVSHRLFSTHLRTCAVKLFTPVSYSLKKVYKKLLPVTDSVINLFIAANNFHPSLIFVGKAEAHLTDSSIRVGS